MSVYVRPFTRVRVCTWNSDHIGLVPRFADESDSQRGGRCNEVWPHFLTDASLMQLIRGREGTRRKRREEETRSQEERRVRAWETLGARRWARSRSSSGRRREHFGNSSRALPQERGEDREQFPKKGIVATQSASHISRRTAYDHVHSFSERPDRT
jgi:hypothetical protein